VWQRAERILEDSDSVLVLGKDTGEHLERLRRIAGVLEELGYHVYSLTSNWYSLRTSGAMGSYT